MRFQNKIFLLFILSIFFTLITTTSFVFYLLQKHNNLYENKAIEAAVADSMLNYLTYKTKDDFEALFLNITAINKEYVKAKVLKKDILVSGITSLLIFLILQALVLFVLIFFVIRAVTFQMRIIYEGIKSAREESYRFPLLRGYEFRAIGNELNRMLEMIAENKNIIKEQSKLAGWQEVSSFLSHQLKNPLTSISFARKNIELCWQLEGQEEMIDTNLTIIGEEIARLNELIGRLKELSAFPDLSKEKLQLSDIIVSVTARYPPDRAEFDLDLPGSPRMMLDRQLMEQVFLNLFTNSLEASVGLPVKIAVRSRYKGGRMEVEISDSVSGLPADVVNKVFIPKFTTKKNGMGLGLSFVKKIIIMHGGRIGVKLSPTGGLVFLIGFKKETGDE